MRIGLVGCGVVADYGHAPAIAQTPGLVLAGVYDPDQTRCKAFAASHGCPSFASLDDLLDADLQGVSICSPPEAHPEGTMGALRRRIPTLCEKPIAPTEAEAHEMIEASRRFETPFAVGFVYRYSPVAQQIRKWIQEGIIGEPRALRLIYLWDLHGQWMTDEKGKWIESPRWRGRMVEGGPMVDCGVHQIDLARWWLGQEVVSTKAAGAWVVDYDAPDHMWLHLDHAAGAHTMVEMSFTYGHTTKEPRSEFSYEVIGTGGVIRYDRNGWVLEARNGEKVVTAPGASEKNFEAMYAAFGHALRTGDFSEMPSPEDGLIATRLAREATDMLIASRSAEVRR